MLARPLPPQELNVYDPTFAPAHDLIAWARSVFIEEGGALHNPDHAHLSGASIGMLWTNVPNSRNGRQIIGQAEFRPPAGTTGKWARARAEAQLLSWFGAKPDFLLTFDAPYAAAAGDAEFCALVEHELYHCGQERDAYGMPRFTRSGLPVFGLRGHDVEEFVGVVARYGAAATGLTAMMTAAAAEPQMAAERIAGACGTCAA